MYAKSYPVRLILTPKLDSKGPMVSWALSAIVIAHKNLYIILGFVYRSYESKMSH